MVELVGSFFCFILIWNEYTFYLLKRILYSPLLTAVKKFSRSHYLFQPVNLWPDSTKFLNYLGTCINNNIAANESKPWAEPGMYLTIFSSFIVYSWTSVVSILYLVSCEVCFDHIFFDCNHKYKKIRFTIKNHDCDHTKHHEFKTFIKHGI